MPARFWKRLEKQFGGVQSDPVRAFLGEHPLVVDALLAMHHVVSAGFSPVERPMLQFRVYSQEDNDFELVVTIPVRMEVEAALASLDALDEAWIEQPDEVRRLVTFNVDYR
jgi:anion-transporting  ArsA/GET3 family ATPase